MKIFKRRIRKPLSNSRPGDEGVSIIEVMVAATVLAIGIFAVAQAFGFGLKLVAIARHRQTASAVANELIEEVREFYRYADVGMRDGEVPMSVPSDPADPGYGRITGDGESFNAAAPGKPARWETFITDGAVAARPNSRIEGGITFNFWEYATWVDEGNDGSWDYKRLTVAVQWVEASRNNQVQTLWISSFFSTGEVAYATAGVTGGATTISIAPPSPSGTGTPTGSPGPGCGSGVTGIIRIVASTSTNPLAPEDTQFSSNTLLNVYVYSDCATEMVFSNDGSTWGSWAGYTGGATGGFTNWTIPGGDGSKTVYAKFRVGINESAVVMDDVILDQTPPSTPSVTLSTSCQGSNRTINVSYSWSDAYPKKTTITKIENGVPVVIAQLAAPPTGDSFSNTHPKTSSVYFTVTAEDQAGNTTSANSITKGKNVCS